MIGSAVINRLGIFAADNLISQGVHLPLDREIESSIKKSFQRTTIDGLFLQTNNMNFINP